MNPQFSPVPGITLRSILSLDPLLEFWETQVLPQCDHMASIFADIQAKLAEIPGLNGDISDIELLRTHKDLLTPLMGMIFPMASFDKDMMATLTPCGTDAFYATPRFQELFTDQGDLFTADIVQALENREHQNQLTLYFQILEHIYGFQYQDPHLYRTEILPDRKTGMDRYYRVCPNFQFVQVRPLTDPPPLSEADLADIENHLTNVEVLARYVDLNQFEFRGFLTVKAVDITESQVVSELEREMLNQNSIFSNQGIKNLEAQLRILLQNPRINLGIGAAHREQVLMVKNNFNTTATCLFTNSQHIPLQAFENSIWLKAMDQTDIQRIPDLAKIENPTDMEMEASRKGLRSLLLAPLFFQEEPIGLLELFSDAPDEFSPVDALKIEPLLPLFSVALKRGLDEMDKEIQAVIKAKCTAVHPSVEWRFEEAAVAHMDQQYRQGEDREMEPIIFKDVVPFFGQSDIRGSSQARNAGIQKDLTHQLHLAADILNAAVKVRPWPLLREYQSRIAHLSQAITQGVTSGDEAAVNELLNQEIVDTFCELTQLGGNVREKIDAYARALDPATDMIYDKRREYEVSVATLNQTLSSYLEKEDGLIQQSFPHYFEKRRTDGVDYMMYIGPSMTPQQDLSNFHIKNMTLWQLMVACGLALETRRIQPELAVPLDTCHLILVNHAPISIRFRYDEKRFDVDGAYDIRNELIKSRLDKALVKGSGERLTQPDQIAVVYSTPAEGKQIRRHLHFMTQLGQIHPDPEELELEDLPDVRGLKAMRVKVDLENMEQLERLEAASG